MHRPGLCQRLWSFGALEELYWPPPAAPALTHSSPASASASTAMQPSLTYNESFFVLPASRLPNNDTDT